MLQKNTLNINFTQGLNQKTDDKQLQLPFLSNILNCRFNKEGKISKRNGTLLVDDTLTYVKLEKSIRESLLTFTSENAYINDLSGNDNRLGQYYSYPATITNEIAGAVGAYQPEIAQTTNHFCYVYIIDGYAHFKIVDKNTNAVIRQGNVGSSAQADVVKVIGIGSDFKIFTYLSNVIYVYTYSNSDNFATPSTTTLITSAWFNFDVAYISASLYAVSVRGQGTNYFYIKTFNASNVLQNSYNDTTAYAAPNAWALYYDSAIAALVQAIDNGSNLYIKILNTSCALGSASTTATGLTFSRISIIRQGIYYYVLCNVLKGTGRAIYGYRFNTSSVLQSGSGIVEAMSNLNSKLVIKDNAILGVFGIGFANGIDEQFLQHLRLVEVYYDGSFGWLVKTVAKHALGDVYQFRTGSSLPNLLENGDELITVYQSRTTLNSTNVTLDTTIKKIAYDMNPSVNTFNVGSSTYVTNGGMLYQIDGQELIESQLYPPFIESIADYGTGSLPSSHTFSYIATYSYVDNNNNIVRSGISNAVSHTKSTTNQNRLTFWMPTYNNSKETFRNKNTVTTDKNNERLAINIYRTTNSGSVYYLAKTEIINIDTTTTTFTIDDNYLDANLISQSLLYTQSELDEGLQEQVKHLAYYNNRIIASDCENKNRVYFSKTLKNLYAPQFVSSFFFDVAQTNDRCLACQQVGDYLVIFKSETIYYTSGNGPNDLGQQNDFYTPKQLSSNIGLKDQKTIIQFDNGIIFKSQNNIWYILSSNLQLIPQYNVEDYFSDTTYCVGINSKKKIIIICNENSTIIYNYLFNSWSIDEETGVKSITFIDSVMYQVDDNKIYKESSGYLLKDTTKITNYFSTPWITISNLSGFQRLYEITLLGKCYGQTDMTITIYYDYNDTSGYDTFTASNIATTSKLEYKVRPTIQKCEAFKMKISNTPDTDNKGIEISGARLIVGMKKGSNKISVNNIIQETV